MKRPDMKRSRMNPPGPPKGAKPSTVPALHSRTTLAAQRPAKGPRPPRPGRRPHIPALNVSRTVAAPKRQVGRILDEDESSLLDLLDNLLNKGVMLNAEVILALANVDLVYLRLSAILCAADRVLPPRGPR